MDFNKIKKICRPVRIIAGLGLIAGAFLTDTVWMYVGILPLIAGITNFCPLCMITKKCDLPQS